jgi:flagellar hook-length control protein FliK
MARSLLLSAPISFGEAVQVLSVTSAPAASAAIQARQPKIAPPDRSAQSGDFGALLDSSLPAETQDTSSAAQQTSASQRRAEDASATGDKARPRDNLTSRSDSANQGANGRADDGEPAATGTSDAGTAGNVSTNAVAAPGARTKSGPSKGGVAQQTEKPSAETATSADPAALVPPAIDAATTPAPIAVAIPVPIALTNVPAVPPANPTATAPVAVAVAAAGLTAGAPVSPAPVLPQEQTNPISGAVDTTSSANPISAPSDPAPVVAAPSAAAAAVVPENAAVIEAAGQSPALPVQQPAPLIETAQASDVAVTVAAEAPGAVPKAAPPKIAAATAKAAASTSDGKSAASAPSSTTPDVTATQSKLEQPAAVKPEVGNDNHDRAKSDGTATKASATIDAPSVHDHSLLPTLHPLNDSAETSSQTAAVIQPALPVAPAIATPAAALSVTAASNGLVPLSGLALEIAASARSGKSRFDIRLDPADLGRIDVRIDVDRTGQVTSHLTVEKPETLTMLRQDAPQLQRALNDAGFKTGDGGLQFSLRDQSSSGNNTGNESGRNAQRLVITEDETIPATIAGRSYGRMLGSTSGVDIRV